MSDIDKDVETLENALRTFGQIMKRPQRWTHIIRQTGVSLDRPSAVILQTLISYEPKKLRLQDLAHRIGVEPPFVTRKTQELEELGYIQRVADPDDRRAVCLGVTAKGRKVANKLWKVQRQTIYSVLSQWPAKDRERFVKLFERFSEDLLDDAYDTDKTT